MSFDGVRHVVVSSLPARAARSTAAHLEAAGQTSGAVAAVARVRAALAQLCPEDRVRAGGVMAGTAAGVHWLLLALMPVHIAPALPSATWVIVAVWAVVVAATAPILVRSWPSSSLRRMWQAVRHTPNAKSLASQTTKP